MNVSVTNFASLAYSFGNPPQKTHFQWLAASHINYALNNSSTLTVKVISPPTNFRKFFLKHKRGTPWKMNGWNLQPSPMKRKENDLNQTSMIMFQPLIFQGVTSGPSQWFPNSKYHHRVYRSGVQAGSLRHGHGMNLNSSVKKKNEQ